MDDNTPPEVKALIDDVVKIIERNRHKINKRLIGVAPHLVGGGAIAGGVTAVSASVPVATVMGSFGGSVLTAGSVLGGAAFGAIGLPVALVAMCYYLEKDKKRNEIVEAFDNIQHNKTVNSGIYSLLCQSEKLVDLKPEQLTKFIDNLPVNNCVIEALIENPKLTEMSDFHPKIKEKILKLDETERSHLLELFNKNVISTTEEKIKTALGYPKEYKERVLAIEAKLNAENPQQYQRSSETESFVDTLPNDSYSLTEKVTPFIAQSVMATASAGTATAKVASIAANPIGTFAIAGTVYLLGKGIKELIKQQIPADKKRTQTEINAQITEIETPLQRLNSILPELTSENLAKVSDNTLGRFFDTSAIMAANGAFDVNNRLKPMVKLLEVIPNSKFDNNSVMNNDRTFIVTDLIKNTIEQQRGDIATDLMTHFIPKVNANNPSLMRDASELSNSFRQELSNIAEKSVGLTGMGNSSNPVDKRKPLGKLLELTTHENIPEYRISDDPTEPMDIPVTGHLPEIINSAIADLRNNQTDTLKTLIKHASEDNPDLIVTGTDIFNGQDKKILGVMLDTLKRAIDPNPINEAMADFLTLYTAGHFAEGGWVFRQCQ